MAPNTTAFDVLSNKINMRLAEKRRHMLSLLPAAIQAEVSQIEEPKVESLEEMFGPPMPELYVFLSPELRVSSEIGD